MKLWLIWQEANQAYDTYDSAVVAAETEDAAKRTVPGRDPKDCDWTSTGMLLVKSWGAKEFALAGAFTSWVEDIKDVNCKYLGDAAEGTQPGVICASFNSG